MKVCSVCHGSHQNSAACTGEFLPDRNEIEEAAADLIPGFHLDGLVTSTSSTATYRARDTASGRSCLVTIFTADEACSEQILHEARVAAGLFHPGIADFYEAGRLDDGRSFIATEDVDGRTLREVLDNVGSPVLLTTIEIIRQAAESLHALHMGGLIHGAINPWNIVLSMSSDGRPTVRLQHPDLGRTAQRSIISNRLLIDSEINSLRYFAPEQCSGEDSSTQCDIYSLGIVLYEMLSGSPPFDAPSAVALIHQQRNQQPPEVKIENFNLRMLVTHALTEALQKQPRLRQSSANTFARQLRHIEQLATHSSTPPPAGVIPRTSAPATPAPSPIVSSLGGVVDATPQVFSLKMENETVGITKADSEAAYVSESEPRESGIVAASEPAAETISVPKPVFVTPRSRLKVWKRKLHSLATRLAPESKAHVASILRSDNGKAVDHTSIESSPDRLTQVENPVSRERRKIQWETPEDDVPSEAAVLEVRALEGISQIQEPVIPAKEQAIEARVVMPSESEVEIPIVEKMPDEKPIETPVVVNPPVADEKPVTITRPVVEPNMPAPENLKSDPIAHKKKAPAVTLAGSVRMVPRMPVGDTSRANARPQKSSPQRSGLGFKVNLADLEEITLVRPPSKRIRIDWERTVARPDLSNIQSVQRSLSAPREIEFSPTILGSSPERVTDVHDRNDGIFSTSYPSASSRFSVRNRAVMIGGGFVALLALFLFGSDSVTKYFQTWSSADSVTMSIASSKEASPPSAPSTPRVKTRALKISEKSAPAIPSTKRTIDRSRNALPNAAGPVPASAAKKKIPVNERPKRSADKKTSEVPDRPNSLTRPRIVKGP